MNFGWLKTAGNIVVKGSGVVQATIAATHAVETMSVSTGSLKEDHAIAVLTPILAIAELASKNTPAVQDAVRKAMQAYVAAQNARTAAEEALAAFEDAKHALEAAVASVKG